MKRILSFILCVLMLLPVIPMMVFAETEYEAQELYSNPFTDSTYLNEGSYGTAASISGNRLYLKNASGGATNIGWWEKAIDVSAAQSDRISISFTVEGIADRGGDLFSINGVLVLKTYSKRVDGVANPAIRIMKDSTNGYDYAVDGGLLRIEFDIVKSTGEGTVTVYDGDEVVATRSIRSVGAIGDTLTVKFGSSNSCKLYIDDLYVGSFIPTAAPEVTKYTVTAVADDVTVDTAEVEEGANYTLPAAPTKDGYIFTGWSDGTNTYAAGAQVAITANTTFTAVFEEITDNPNPDPEPDPEPVVKYTVTAKVDDTTVDTAEIEEGASYTLPAAQNKDGYTFKGWSDGTMTYAAGASVVIVGNTTFTAIFEELAPIPEGFVAKDFSSNIVWGGAYRPTELPAKKTTTTENGMTYTSFTVTTTNSIGYDRGMGPAIIMTDGVSNLNGAKYLTIKYRYTMAGEPSTDFRQVWPAVDSKWYVLVIKEDGTTYGADCTTVASDNGLVWNEWAYMNFDLSGIAENATIKEIWLYPYKPTGTNTSTDYPARPYGTFPRNTYTGARNNYICFIKNDKIDIGMVYYSATEFYEGVKHDVTAVADGVTVDTAKIEEGTSYTLPTAPSKYGYDFVGWTDGVGTYAAGAQVAITKETTFTAVYKIQEGMSVVNVTVVSDGVTISTEPVVTGAQYLLPAAPVKDKYNFVGWSDGTTTYAASEKVTINTDTTFTAIFVPKVYYNVTVKADGTTVDTATIEENTTYTLPAAPSKDGYNFKGWSDGVNTYAAGAQVTITGETTFEAVFAIKVYHQVTVVSDGETVATATVEEGTYYTLPAATTKEEHKFVYWTDGSQYYKAGAKAIIVGATTFEAVFAPLGDGTVIYQNSFTDEDDLNEASQMGASVALNYGRIEFLGSSTAWWRKNVHLDNATGDVTITFKLYPNILSSYNILAINGKTLLSTFYATDVDSWPYATWLERGFRFGPSYAARGALELHECYGGYNDLDNEAIVTATIDTETGDTVVNVEYDCGENGKYSFTSDTLNVGPLTDTVQITLGMFQGGNYMRMDDLVVKQADGQPFGSNDVVEREIFAFFADNFEGSVKGESTLISYLNTSRGNKITLEDGNTVITGGVQTTVTYPGAFPTSTAIMSFDFMIPEFPENPNDNDQITILTDQFSKSNHLTVKYSASLGKWIAGPTTNDLNMTDYVIIEEGKWNHVVIMFNKGTYINGEYAGMSSMKDRTGSFLKMTGKSYGDVLVNVATYYVDNLYLANGCFDNDVIRVTGYQKSDIVDGKYNVRFVCALPTLFEKQTKVGFEISSPSNGKVFDPYETTKVYNSLSANYGTDTITAKSLGAQALVAVAVHGIPEALGNVDLVIKPYVIIDGQKIYGSTVYMNPAGSDVEYDGICDINVVDPEQTPITVDPNGALAGKKVVILVGQSQMAGRGDVETVELIDDDRLWMWRDGEFIKLTEPAFTDKPDDAGTSPGVAFAKAYAETYDEDVVVLPMAVGGTAIAYWSPGNQRFNDTVDAARLAIEQGGEVIAVLWHQGESDAANKSNKIRYTLRYVELIQQLYSAIGLDYETVPFIVGNQFPNHPDASASDPETMLYTFSNATGMDMYYEAVTYPRAESPMLGKGVDPDIVVGKEDVPTLYGIVDGTYLRSEDKIHLDAPSTRVFGYRFFNVYQELVNGDVDGDGNIDYYDFADSLDLPEGERTIANVGAILDSYLVTAE